MSEIQETTEDVSKPRTRDPELAAMSRIANMLAALPPNARKRVQTYFLDRLNDGDLPRPTS